MFCILIGRLIWGFASGGIGLSLPRIVEENVPPQWVKYYGPVTPVSFTIGSVIIGVCNLAVPSEHNLIEHTNSWRFVYGIAIVPVALS